MTRNHDGTFRNHNKPTTVSNRTLIARWVEAEALRLKVLGFGFEQIADQLTRVGRGQRRSLTQVPPDLEFPPDYRISAVACRDACDRALSRQPRIEAGKLRQLINERCEQLYFALQSSVQRGDPRSINVSTRVLELKARINCLMNDKASSSVVVVENQRRNKDKISLESMNAGIDLFREAVAIVIESGGAPHLEHCRELLEPKAVPSTNGAGSKENKDPGKK